MSKLQQTLLALAICFTVASLFITFKVTPRAGSVSLGSEYLSTTTDATWNSSYNTVVSGPGTLGNVVVTLTSNAPIAFYDATTTGPHSDHPTTTIAAFRTTTAGTYVFDAVFTRGLVVETVSTVGKASTTITYRVR